VGEVVNLTERVYSSRISTRPDLSMDNTLQANGQTYWHKKQPHQDQPNLHNWQNSRTEGVCFRTNFSLLENILLVCIFFHRHQILIESPYNSGKFRGKIVILNTHKSSVWNRQLCCKFATSGHPQTFLTLRLLTPISYFKRINVWYCRFRNHD